MSSPDDGHQDGLIAAVHPLIVCLLLLYLVPGLFSDPVAQALVNSCQLDAYIQTSLS